MGRLIKIPAPITSSVDARVRKIASKVIDDAKRRGEWPVLIFDITPGSSDFGKALDLADYISSLNGATTVAYLPESIKGHAVLLALACEQIVMAPEAEIGEAGADEQTITDAMRNLYADMANRRRTIPTDLALGMLDPQLEVWQIETEVSREFVLSNRLEEVRQKHAFTMPDKPLIPAGEPGRFTGQEARELGFASYLAEDREDLVKALGLPREAMLEDLSAEGAWRAVRVQLKGPIDAGVASTVQNVIQDELARDVNFIVLWIDSPGGSPESSLALASYLTGPALKNKRIVAYIPTEARADAAFVALACDDIVMHPNAILGGSGAYQIAETEIAPTVESLRAVLKEKFRSWSLPAAMVNPKLVVHRYTHPATGQTAYFSEEELAEQPKPDEWNRGEQVAGMGTMFRVEGEAAPRFGLASEVVESFDELRALYGLEKDPRLVEPGWADFLIDALASPGVGWLLLLVGGAALYAEFQSPGIGIGAFIATVCFVLFFWAHYLGGTAGWLEIVLFVVGVVCILLEIFVLPGFGIFGLGGGLLVMTSLVLASQTFRQFPQNDYQFAEMRDSLLVLAGAGFGVIIAIAAINRFLPRTPVLNQMVLAPPSDAEQAAISRREAVADYAHLVGHRGTAVTQLTPAGKARFDDQLVDVIADGEVIARGAEVVVVQARANRVVVRSA